MSGSLYDILMVSMTFYISRPKEGTILSVKCIFHIIPQTLKTSYIYIVIYVFMGIHVLVYFLNFYYTFFSLNRKSVCM